MGKYDGLRKNELTATPEGQRHGGEIRPGYSQSRQADNDGQDCPGHSGGGQTDEEVDVVFGDQVPGHHATDAGEGELAQADVARPAGEHDQRQGDDPVDQSGGVLEDGARSGHQRDGDEYAADDEAHGGPSGDDFGQLAQGLGDGLEDAGGAEGGLGIAGSAGLLLEEQQAEDDGHQVDHVGHGRAVLGQVELEQTADDTERRPGSEGQGQILHAGDDGGGQGRQNEFRSGGGGHRDALRRRGQDAGQGGQQSGDDPDQGGQPLDRDAEKTGPIGVVGHRAHGRAGIGLEQEPAQGDQHHRDGNGDQEVVAVEEHREDEGVVRRQRRGDAADVGRTVEPLGHEELDATEELGQTDGDHHHDQAGGVEEAPPDDDVDQQSKDDADHQRHRDADEPVDVLAQVHFNADGGRQGAHGPVREVDDSRCSIRQHQAERQQSVDGPEFSAVEDLPAWGVVMEQHGYHEQHHGRDGDREQGATQPRRQSIQR